jgi:hypothetical protein
MKSTLVYGKAKRNTIRYRIVRRQAPVAMLSERLSGLRVLHLSDLHTDGIIDEGRRLAGLLGDVKYDICFMTGDFRYETSGTHIPAIDALRRIAEVLDCTHGVYAVLGNHDCLDMVAPMEAMGIRVLLNEAVEVKHGGQSVWVVGVDDPHYFGTDDLPKALSGVPRDATKLLLAHSPEIIETAAAAGIHYYFCGHSHGGQLCLPWGVPVVTNSRCSSRYAAGSWKYGSMSGYTSRGAGSSGLPARLFCAPEIAVHSLVPDTRVESIAGAFDRFVDRPLSVSTVPARTF